MTNIIERGEDTQSGKFLLREESKPMDIKATLKFGTMGWDNKGFIEGVNMTARKGVYWDMKVRVGDYVEIATYDGNVVDTAVITGKIVTRFCDVPDDALKRQHEISFQDYNALLGAMKTAYGANFHHKEICTFLFFELLRYEA